MVARLNEIEGISCLMPPGAFYAFPDVKEILEREIDYNWNKIKNSFDLSNYILKVAEVAVVPGIAFKAEGYLRISYATSMENIKEGLDRIEKLLK
ncbi:unnamed protein product [marine sediment metagenome]|uniref:Aminotransferase class I/classII large domain-containing protein n=1 Tax=marine sediment metagenome TaxID=412755 RepID=X1E021_9ZZZZ